MAKTSCKCGVGLWNGYGPGGVNWDIFPMNQFKELAYANPTLSLADVDILISEKYYDNHFHDLWLCRRCKRIQIWKMDNLYVAYEPVDFDGLISLDEIFKMEEWIAINDYDLLEDYNAIYVLENYPFRPYQFFLSNDKSKIYVYNRDQKTIEFVYEEYCREIEEDIFRDRKGIYRIKYENHLFVGAFYEDGTEVEYILRNAKLSGAVYGFVLGDALGVPYEFMERDSFECNGMVGYGTHNQPAGTWSDDTSLMLATCKSLKENGLKVNIEDMKNKFKRWLNDGDFTANGTVFDVGHTTLKALTTGVARSGESSNGNGSLMRILPLAFVDCTDDEIRAVSGITHNHWIAKEACVIYVNLIKKYINQDWSTIYTKSLSQCIRELPKLDPPFDRLYKLEQLSRKDIKSSGYVVDTLEAALWCILQMDKGNTCRTRGYRECLMTAVNLGGDTDTIAAITGGLAGLKYSFDEIPDDWVWKIKNNKLIQECLW